MNKGEIILIEKMFDDLTCQYHPWHKYFWRVSINFTEEPDLKMGLAEVLMLKQRVMKQ